MKKTKRQTPVEVKTRIKAKTNVSTVIMVVFSVAVFGGLSLAWLASRTLKTQKTQNTSNTSTANINTSTFIPPPVTSAAWTNTNPGGGGAFTSIAAGPTGIILVGSDLSGAYRSLDRGQTWDVIGSLRGLATTHVSAVAMHPTDASVMYLGTEAGLYRSTNGGDNFVWHDNADPRFDDGYVTAVHVARADPSEIYAGVQIKIINTPPTPNVPSYQSTRVRFYKSTDNGVSWTVVGSDRDDTRVLKIITDPLDQNIVFFLSGPDHFTTVSTRLYRSVDGGANWTQIGGTFSEILDFTVDQGPNTPGNPADVFLTTKLPDPSDPTNPNKWIGFVQKSSDRGDSWLPRGQHTGLIFVKRDEPQTIRTVDIERWSLNSEAGIWKSDNDGATWTLEAPASNWDSGYWQGNDGWDVQWAYGKNSYGYPKTLGLDESNAGVMMLVNSQFVQMAFDGSSTTFQNLYTTQVGTNPNSWRGRSLDNAAIMELAVTEADPQRLYSGSYDLGLWRSTDGGMSWQNANSYRECAGAPPCEDGDFVGSWNGYGGNTTTIVADPTRANVVWATMAKESWSNSFKLVKSVDSGRVTMPTYDSWEATNLPKGFISGLSLDRTSLQNKRILFVTKDGDVYKSTDDGMNWAMVLDCNGCRTTAVDPNTGQVVYAGGEGGFFRSLDGGNTWSGNLSAVLAGSAAPTDIDTFQWTGVHEIVPDRFTWDKVYAVAYGKGGDKGLYVSGDKGTTWTLLRAGKYSRGMTVDRFDARKMYLTSSYATRNGHWRAEAEGALRSTDGGATWTPFNEGLAWTFGWPVVVRPTQTASPQTDPNLNYRIFIGSPGTGFFMRDITSTSGSGGGGKVKDPLVIPD